MLAEETILGFFLIPQVLFIICLLAFIICLLQRVLKMVWDRNGPELNSVMVDTVKVLYLKHLSLVACCGNIPECFCLQSIVFTGQGLLWITNQWLTKY